MLTVIKVEVVSEYDSVDNLIKHLEKAERLALNSKLENLKVCEDFFIGENYQYDYYGYHNEKTIVITMREIC